MLAGGAALVDGAGRLERALGVHVQERVHPVVDRGDPVQVGLGHLDRGDLAAGDERRDLGRGHPGHVAHARSRLGSSHAPPRPGSAAPGTAAPRRPAPGQRLRPGQAGHAPRPRGARWSAAPSGTWAGCPRRPPRRPARPPGGSRRAGRRRCPAPPR